MISSSRSISVAVRLEVGSSMMTRRALSDSALAISSSWRCAIDRPATGVDGEKSAASLSSSGWTARLAAGGRQASSAGRAAARAR